MLRTLPTTLLALLLTLSASAANPPNIVVVMTDDQGCGDFGFTGNQVIRTPNLDQMARESAQMMQFYVSPVCSPTRACLMTGRYNYRTRAIDTFKGRSMMDPEEITVAEHLKTVGYATGLFGKWHLGDNHPLRPQDQGFDEVLMHQGGGLAQNSEPIGNDRRYTDAILRHNGELVETKGYCTDVYFSAALDYMESCVSEGKPFFTYIATNAPHGPYHDAPKALYEEYLKKPDQLRSLIRQMPSDRKDRDGLGQIEVLASIAAMITNVDENMGRLMAKLEVMGVAKNTLVIFLTDNGPNTTRYVGPYRGNKSQVYEGGVHTIFLARWPGTLPAGHLSNALGAHIDIAPTLIAAAGVEDEPSPNMDGKNLLPLLKGEVGDADWPTRQIVLQSHRGNAPVKYHNFMLRESSGWKLLNASGFSRNELPPGGPKLELYNLIVDPSESVDLSAAYPKIVERLKKAYERWFDAVSSSLPDNYAPPRIALGTTHEHPVLLTGQDARVDADEKSIGWQVKSGRAGTYRVRFLDVEPLPAQAQFVVEVDGKNVATSSSGTDMEVPLPEGEFLFSARIQTTDGSELGYQIELSWE